jgi:aryl-alcohol dehydrogenase-like predicted oxidoreductase
MTYGSGFEWMISDEQEAIKQMKYAYDQGINVSHSHIRILLVDF